MKNYEIYFTYLFIFPTYFFLQTNKKKGLIRHYRGRDFKMFSSPTDIFPNVTSSGGGEGLGNFHFRVGSSVRKRRETCQGNMKNHEE